MAIAKMKKIRLVGVSYEKQLLLDALAQTGAVQIRCTEEDWQSAQEDSAVVGVTEKVLRIERAIDFVEGVAQKNIKGYARLKEPLSIKFDNFLTVMDNSTELERALSEIEGLVAKQQENNRQLQKTRAFLSQIAGFSAVDVPFSAVENTKNVVMFLGSLPTEGVAKLTEYFATECNLAVVEKLNETDNGCMVFVLCHNSQREGVSRKLSELNFVKCPFNFDKTPKEKADELNKEISDLEKREEDLLKQVLTFADKLNDLRLYCDRLECEGQKNAYC